MNTTKKVIIGFVIIFAIVFGYRAYKNSARIATKGVIQEPIKIGAILPLTGNSAFYGEPIKTGMDLATEEINASGGIQGKDLQVVYEDSQADTKLGVSAYQKLANMDGIKFILSTISGPTMAIAPLAEADKNLLFAIGVAAPKLSEAGDYVFRHNLLPQTEMDTLVDFLYSKKGIKEIGILVVNAESGIGYRGLFKQAFEKVGGKIIVTEMYEKNAADYKTQIAKIKSLKVKNMIAFSYAQELGTILKQSKELNLDSQWFSFYAIEDAKMLEIAGNAAEGLIYTHFFNPASEAMNAFKEKYFSRTNKNIDAWAALAYDNVKITAEAMKNCANPADATCVKDEFYKIKDFPGITGKITFDKNGDTSKDVIIKTVKDGKFMPLEN